MMFINFTPATGITISHQRAISAYYGEIIDLVMAVTYNHESCCCDLDDVKAALEDGAYLQHYRGALEALRDAVREATNNPDPSDPVLRPRAAPDA
jgi:hypothetical protein